ncbi:hypothetical protein BLNAU_17472 [Blattamonas nauphoetae]|uniref:Protein kinase domain-containing protein n=1 Tax=Blattamonas nauphoetae TaxID=2049346 RepID=A0ABQ9X8J3_9EUKA|nr:hypothetical protein BLNAU_17472 [Blattamonas nauphoetae]
MGNTKVMVMELGGKSLAEIMKDFTERKVLMPRDDVYRVMEDIASALELMHNHESGKTAHGDVKLDNILIDRDGHAKLYVCITGTDRVGDRKSDMRGRCVVVGSCAVLAAVWRATIQEQISSETGSRDLVIQTDNDSEFVRRRRTSLADANDG